MSIHLVRSNTRDLFRTLWYACHSTSCWREPILLSVFASVKSPVKYFKSNIQNFKYHLYWPILLSVFYAWQISIIILPVASTRSGLITSIVSLQNRSNSGILLESWKRLIWMSDTCANKQHGKVWHKLMCCYQWVFEISHMKPIYRTSVSGIIEKASLFL